VDLTFQDTRGQVALDQIRAVDRTRLVRKLARISPQAALAVSRTLIEMFTRESELRP
jgi:mRNA interferase MazF